ncbi:hypothetical protein GCM10025795_12830 [Verticiella sediminum]
MKRATLALLVSAAFASPMALAAATESPATPAPAVNSPATEASGANPGPASTPDTTNQAMTDDERGRLNKALGTGTAGPDRANAKMQSLSVKDINGRDVQNGQGEKIGEVSDVVASNDGTHYIVIGKGGFFGIGEDRAALPADRFWVRDDDLVVLGVTETDIETMDDARTGDDEAYKDVDNDVMVELAVWQQP